MSYIPTEWKNGDVITSEKLNKIENGIKQAVELPSAMLADVGKVLTVERDASGTPNVLFEETEVTLTSQVPYVAIANASTDLFVVGNSVTITIDGTDYPGEIVNDSSAVAVQFSNQTMLIYTSELGEPALYFVCRTPGTYTISATIVAVTATAGWDNAPTLPIKCYKILHDTRGYYLPVDQADELYDILKGRQANDTAILLYTGGDFQGFPYIGYRDDSAEGIAVTMCKAAWETGGHISMKVNYMFIDIDTGRATEYNKQIAFAT